MDLNNVFNSIVGRRQSAPQNASRFNNSYGSNVIVTMGDTGVYDTAARVYGLLGAAAAGYFKIWEMTVKAQRGVAWGFGSALTPYNQGYMWFASLKAGTGFDTGTIRMCESDSAEGIVLVVKELDDTNRVHTTTSTTLVTAQPTDMAQMTAVPEQTQRPIVQEDSKISIKYAAITRQSTDTIGFSIPVTQYY